MTTTSDDDTIPLFPTSDEEPAPPQSPKKAPSRLRVFANLPLIYFLVAALLSIGCYVLYIMDNNIGYIVSAPIGLIVCSFGIKHFRTLINLKHEIDKYYQLNRKFKVENTKLRRSVEKLRSANKSLKETHDRLYKANEKNRQNLTHFREVQYNMEQFNAESVEQLQDVTSKAKVIENKWRDELFQHERTMLHTVFDRFCSDQNHMGMTKKEFDEFSLQLPAVYQDRFGRMGTFAKMSGNKDVILLEDFEATLDIFAEMQATDCDIEFEIKSTKQRRAHKPSIAFRKKKTEYFNQRRKSTILKYVNQDELESIDDDIDDNNNNNNNYNINTNGNTDNNDNNNNYDLVDDDDRKYDDELITYQSEIVITSRTRSRSVMDRDSMNLNIATRARSNDIAILKENEEISPITSPISSPPIPSSPIPSPIATGGRQLFRRTNIYGGSVMIRDISDLPDTPPVMDNMTTQSIEYGSFSDKQINRYMSDNVPSQPPNIANMTTQSIEQGTFSNKEMNQIMESLRTENKYKK